VSIRSTVFLGAALLGSAPLGAQTTEAAPAPPAPFTPAEEARYMELGRNVTRWFFNGAADSMYAAASEDTRKAMGGVEGIREQMDEITNRAGYRTLVVEEKMTRRDGMPQFWHEALFSDYTNEPLVFRWIFNEQGELVGAGINPKSKARKDG
ncbi:MAG TPA: hypothetical protein PLL69_08180, partial [Gemmatimonadales bacterium]|nr:hypothetical protein [Gemmatimonadales bacterium]